MKGIFASINDPDSAAEAAVELFGVEAATAVAYCALQARSDERKEDYKFWFETFCRLTGRCHQSGTRISS
ncbi:hypothetical protein [Rhizobium laguerreae]|uniref:hypothetical protein n=1 Tax=Rhizobium laguerreae TaxID=1076926 RepID=UPI001389570B|nr:hypothetical protein [Rhizobium laguerreae]NDK52802.1 hypothetical protein [Rhizobium laguerreae]